MSKINAVPVSTLQSDGQPAVGSAFLIKKCGRTWLVTAAHISTMRPQPNSHWWKWPELLCVYPNPAVSFDLPLFSGSPRRPRFRHFAYPDGDIADFMAVEVPANYAVHLTRYRVFACEEATTLAAGGELSGTGYPHKFQNWPYEEPDKWVGLMIGPRGPALHIDGTTIVGHSGGPIVGDDGRLVGMAIGTTLQADGSTPVIAVPATWICQQLPS